jgi:hypothetical protein
VFVNAEYFYQTQKVILSLALKSAHIYVSFGKARGAAAEHHQCDDPFLTFNTVHGQRFGGVSALCFVC